MNKTEDNAVAANRECDFRVQIGGAAGGPPIVADFARSSRQAVRSTIYRSRFTESLRQQLFTLGRDQQANPGAVLFASFAALLYRLSAESHLLVGTLGRTTSTDLGAAHDQQSRSPLRRITIEEQQRFSDLVSKVQELLSLSIIRAHECISRAVEQPSFDASGVVPVPAAIFAWHGLQGDEQSDTSASCATTIAATGTEHHALSVSARANNFCGIEIAVDYDQNVFADDSIARLIEHWQILLNAALANPELHVSQLAMLSPDERDCVTHGFNDTARPYSRDATVHELFERQAERSPDRIALVDGSRQITYRELNSRANQLAHRLRRLGIGRGMPVAMCLERSPAMIECVLAILKAGGAYVPLDPNYPPERLAFMLRDVDPQVLVTTARLAELSPSHRAQVLNLDEPIHTADPGELSNLASNSGATDLAYIMYTSGSEGLPKGVEVVHRGIVRLVQNVDYIALGPDEVFLQLAPISFDASTFEIWGCLLHGGRLVLMPPHPPSLQEIGAAIARHEITTLWLTAALFHQIVDYSVQELRGVRQLCTGGDVVSVSHAARVLQELPHTRLLNCYGPTESTTFATSRVITADDLQLASLPIGGPIANTRAYILDNSMQPLPVGVPGELYLAGDGLAAGYWKRPELTAERFVQNPFDASGARLYRTGDRARWRADGSIEFLGRRDRQVKIRGFRVELGEIEIALTRHPAVSGVVVLVQSDAHGEKRLAAFVSLRAGETATAADLRRFLAAKLPAYLVPSTWNFVDALPQSSVGKIDRQALSARLGQQAAVQPAYEAPRTHFERVVAHIWAEVLRLPRVGIHDDFFALGGHSLKAAAASARLYRSLGFDVSLERLFALPTVFAFASWLEAQSVAANDTTLAIPRAPREERLPLSSAQQGLWVLDQVARLGGAYNIPVALRIRGPLDVAALESCFETLVHRHEILRTIYRSGAQGVWQEILPCCPFNLERVDLSGSSHTERSDRCEQWLNEQAARPFNLASDLMLRASLVCLDDQEHILLIVVHHIAADGWSIDILLRELASLYAAQRQMQTEPLAELPLQYADYAAWDHAHRPELQEQLAYWHKRLAGSPDVTSFPTDRPRSDRLGFEGMTLHSELSAQLVAQLENLAHTEQVTLFMVLLSALYTLLYQETGEHDLVVGTPVAGRRRVELEGLIGFFVNMLPLRADLSGELTFRQLIHRVRDIALGAYAHQDVPFGLIVEEVRPARSLSYMPIFQVALAMQYVPRAKWTSPELRIEPYSVETGSARYDLTIFVQGQSSGGLEIAAEYNSELFSGSTVTRLVEHWTLLLESLVADPECALSRLPQPRCIDGARPDDAMLDNRADDFSLAARHGDCEQRLVDIWARLLELNSVGLEDDFFDLGGTSLLAIRLFAEIEHAFGKRLDYAVFFQSPTIASLAENLQGLTQDRTTPLVVLQPDGSGSPLFITYSVDGELLYWQDLLRNLGRDHPVYGFQPREVEGAPWPYESVEEVAADCVAQLQAHYPVGPCCLAGFSFGGKVAYEIAQQLRRAGREVALLAIVDTPPAWETPQSLRGVLLAAPACLWNFPPWFLGMTRNWREFPLRRKIRQRMHRMRDFLNARLGLKRRAPPTPTYENFFELKESTDRGRQLIPRLFSAFLKYRPAPYAGRLLLFRARTRPLIHVPRHDLGWGEYAAAVDVEVIPGSHSTILKEPHVRSLAIALVRKLSNVPMVRKPD